MDGWLLLVGLAWICVVVRLVSEVSVEAGTTQAVIGWVKTGTRLVVSG